MEQIIGEERPLPLRQLTDQIMEVQMPPLRITSFKMIGDYQCVIENKFIRGETKLVSKAAKKIDLKGNFDIIPFKPRYKSSDCF